MTIIHDGEPVDFANLFPLFVKWLKQVAWLSTDGDEKIAAAKAITEIWEWAEELLTDEWFESGQALSESSQELAPDGRHMDAEFAGAGDGLKLGLGLMGETVAHSDGILPDGFEGLHRVLFTSIRSNHAVEHC